MVWACLAWHLQRLARLHLQHRFFEVVQIGAYVSCSSLILTYFIWQRLNASLVEKSDAAVPQCGSRPVTMKAARQAAPQNQKAVRMLQYVVEPCLGAAHTMQLSTVETVGVLLMYPPAWLYSCPREMCSVMAAFVLSRLRSCTTEEAWPLVGTTGHALNQ